MINLTNAISNYLYDIRRKGNINMFDTPEMLEKKFSLSKKEAWKVFSLWVETFDYEKGRRRNEETPIV